MNKVGNMIGGSILFIFIISVIAIMISVIYYNNTLKPYETEENGKEITIEIPEKTGISAIAKILEENQVIKDDFTFKVYLKLNKKINLQAGKYVFNNGKDDVENIVKKLSSGDIIDDSINTFQKTNECIHTEFNHKEYTSHKSDSNILNINKILTYH